MQGPTQTFGPIGSAVLTFIGYKQTSKVYIDIDLYFNEPKGIDHTMQFKLYLQYNKPNISSSVP